MNYTRILIGVAIMALVTYIPRMLPLAIFRKKIKSRFIRSFLAYVPYAVLAAMTFPEILFWEGAAYRGAFFHGGGLCGGTDFKMDGTSLDRYN